MTRVGSMNEKDLLPVTIARADLLAFIAAYDPDVIYLQEWPSSRDQILNDLPGRKWYRPGPGGGPIVWKTAKRTLKSGRAIRLSGPEIVGHLIGRKTRLGASYATEVILEVDGAEDEAHLNYHLTANVQFGSGYRTDLKYRLRVQRHKREKRAVGRRARFHIKHARRTRAGGDSNFAHMTIGGLISAWKNRPGGTLGGRPVDDVQDEKPALRVHTFKTHSDHRAVCVES